ncbi:MAG: nucleotide exchange factor GrpE [Pseudomonadota bacterium]|nr:nucleotide exchange factor GrpE [Pseudomonadota bacterium]
MNKRRFFGVEEDPVEVDASELDPQLEPGDEIGAESVEVTVGDGAGGAESAEDLRVEMEQALREAEVFKDQYLRAKAEMENIRRRSQKEVANTRKYAIDSFAAELLPVKESLDRAAQVELDENAGEAVTRMVEGLTLTLRQLDAAFNKFSISEVAPEKGDPFDPELHQAMTMLPTDEVAPNEIVDTVQKGFRLQDRLLRPAMVVVAKAPE